MKNLLILLVAVLSVSHASNNLDYGLTVEGEDDTLHFGAALVTEGKGSRYMEGDHSIFSNGVSNNMSVTSGWEARHGIKAELVSKQFTLRAAYFDDEVGSTVERLKNGSSKEDFLRKEDLVRFLEIGFSNDFVDLYFLRDFNRYGTYTLGDEPPKEYSTSMMKAGLKMYGRTKAGSVGMLAEFQKFRTLRVLRIGEVQADGTTKLVATHGPFNKEVNGFVAGMFRAPDPSGRLYVTYTMQGTVGVSESPFEEKEDIGLEGYYLQNEKYDLLANIDGSIIAGFNAKLGRLRIRLSGEAFVKSSFAAPASQVYAVGNTKHTKEDKNLFTEEYSDYEIVYGYAAQLKLIF